VRVFFRGPITLSVENTIPSKLVGEFCEVERIGKGAYGKVYKVCEDVQMIVLFNENICYYVLHHALN